ncbi:hypothetical protein DV736_g5279, partial [Chaetothyriales sp. CBS 134916]
MASFDDTIAFIGLGVMGFRMAANLRSKMRSDKVLLILDVSEEALSRFEKQTAGQGEIRRVKNGFEAAQQANTVISMLPTAAAVEAVYLDPVTGVIAGVRKAAESSKEEKLIMECGTIETATILKVADAFKRLDEALGVGSSVEFVDAPVSGGPMGAEAGTLTFMVGGTPLIFQRAKKTLNYMGNPNSIFHCGDVGAGTAFKIINNYLSAITSLAASEALNIGAKMGLDLKLLTDVINQSGGQCWVTSKSNPVPGILPNAPASRGYEGGFRIELCKKVLKMGSELAEMVGAKTVLDVPTQAAFEEAAAKFPQKDARVLYKWLNESER